MEWQAGKGYMGGAARPAPGETFDKVLRAVNIQTGEIAWDLPQVTARPHRVGGVVIHRVGSGVLRREQRRLHGGRRGDRQSAVGIPVNHTWHARR